jgi:hypothetical protein
LPSVPQEPLPTEPASNVSPVTPHAEHATIIPAAAPVASQERDISRLPSQLRAVSSHVLREPSPRTTSVKSVTSSVLNALDLPTTVSPAPLEDSFTTEPVGTSAPESLSTTNVSTHAPLDSTDSLTKNAENATANVKLVTTTKPV